MRLSKKMLNLADLEVGSLVEIKAANGQIIIQKRLACKKLNLPFSEEKILSGLNAYGAHADELAEPNVTEVRVT
ncbi:MazF family transcriptional regulator [Candidatus Kaiserbacteria bacterium]|nr:MAG: MazF family transcriptional regulator [Candidatus Kaiserbacteria bacterium]